MNRRFASILVLVLTPLLVANAPPDLLTDTKPARHTLFGVDLDALRHNAELGDPAAQLALAAH
jgi:hypothetical protein